MTYEMLGTSSISALRAACDPFDLPSNSPTNGNGFGNAFNNNNNGGNNGVSNFPFKPLAMTFSPTPSPIRPHLTIAEQAELEFELRYRGNMIVDQQRKIQQLEEELKRTRDQVDIMNTQLNSYEQERQKEKKKPQSRYWTPDEHQRFLEALSKYGHKDVKAISNYVSTRNATQVRTHAQKYFLRLERERRKKNDEEGGKLDDLYNSSGDELYNSDQSSSPIEELSPPTNIASPPHPALLQGPPPQQQALNTTPPVTRRRRSTSLIAPAMGKTALQYQAAVLAELPNWSGEDYEQFAKGLLSLIDKQEDIGQVCRSIRDGYVPHRTIEDVESCYKTLHKTIKQKPVLITAPIGSPKRRRTSKPELPINMPTINEGPLPALGSMPPINGGNNTNNNFVPFLGSMPNVSGAPLPPPPQYMNANSINNANHSPNSNNSSNNTLLPFQPSMGLMNMNVNMNMNMRPLMDYGNVPSMQALQISNLGMGMSNLGMMDIGSPTLPPANSSNHNQWNSLALSFDLHQNPHSLSLPHHGAPLVPSLN